MRRLNAGKLFIFLVVALSGAVVTGCAWLLQNNGPVPFVVQSEIISLAWDSQESYIADQPDAIDHYRVFYRVYGTAEWQFLHETAGSEPLTTIGSWELDFGNYEFAVQEVYRDERKSEMHSSSDFDAWPSGGWYVVWEAP